MSLPTADVPGAAAPPAETLSRALLTPWRCRATVVILLALGAVAHLHYLMHACPLDLSGDEAHYWDWSRQLDLSYYSKGPLVAYLIRASCATFGDVMWAVRLPAIVLAAASSLLTYWLTARLFSSERLALGAVLLTHLVPLFVAGSMLMTIDPPMYFCWAAATCFTVKAVWDGRTWAWMATGAAVGFGFLAKYAMAIWLVGWAIFLLLDPSARRCLRTVWPWTTLAVAVVFTTPVIVWNASHGWVSLRHVATQTGTESVAGRPLLTLRYLAQMLGGQIGALGPVLWALVVVATCSAVGVVRRRSPDRTSEARALLLLLAVGLPVLVAVALTSLRTKTQVNWPAPAYFTLLILATWFLATRLRSPKSWKPWRGWFWGGVVAPGLLLMPLAHDFSIAYPALQRAGELAGIRPAQFNPRKVDPSARLRGWSGLGSRIGDHLSTMRAGAFVLCLDYQHTAEAAFYTPGQPRTYCAGAYLEGHRAKRLTQYDLWPDRRLDRSDLRGRDAVYVGYMQDEVRRAFESVARLPDHVVVVRGATVRRFPLWRCTDFKGMRPPTSAAKY
jgi:undecaprenyl-diphosphatase